MTDARIPAPWGYRQVIPLQKTHRVKLTEPGMAPAFSLALHAVPLGASEFPLALRDYPIVFLRTELRFQAMAILGVEEGQNLFVMPDGRWDRRSYIPAYVRRYPFCIAAAPGATPAICVDPTAVVEGGDRLFDEQGNPLQHWLLFERLLKEYEDELARAHRLAEALKRLQVLVPFSLRAELSSGFALRLENLYRVERARLANVDPAALRELVGDGQMDLVYAHLLSQDNFLRLMSRRGVFSNRAVA